MSIMTAVFGRPEVPLSAEPRPRALTAAPHRPLGTASPAGRARPRPVDVSGEAVPATYEALAAEMGFAPADLERARLRTALASARVPLYDLREVSACMEGLTQGTKNVWFWHPLRAADDYMYDEENQVLSPDFPGRWREQWRPGAVRAGLGNYPHLVPEQVLRRGQAVLRLASDLGHRPRLLVSHYAVPDPDPFMAVVTDRVGEPQVFAVWGEPGFSGAAEV